MVLQKKMNNLVREASELKNVTKVEKVQKGGGDSAKNQTFQNAQFGLFDKRGEAIFSLFPQK